MGNNANSSKTNLIFPELSYKIIGAAFSVFNGTGWGLSEKHYQKLLAEELDDCGIAYKREVFIPFHYKTAAVRYFADFVIEDSIILELKVVKKLGYSHVGQVLDYIKVANLRLGILLYFTLDGVKYRRIVNSQIVS